MSEPPTHNLPDGRSFEERVFARFDAVDAGLRDLSGRVQGLETRMQSLETRVERLEAESERRAVETKPLWERALAGIAAVRQDVAVLGQKVDALTERMYTVERKLDIIVLDMNALRAEQRRLDERVYKLESNPMT